MRIYIYYIIMVKILSEIAESSGLFDAPMWKLFLVSASTMYHTSSEVDGVRSKTRKTGSFACLVFFSVSHDITLW